MHSSPTAAWSGALSSSQSPKCKKAAQHDVAEVHMLWGQLGLVKLVNVKVKIISGSTLRCI